MKKISLFSLLSIIVVSLYSFGVFPKDRHPKTVADKIFINGKILTVDTINSIAQAVAIKDGKILAVGANKQIEALKGEGTVVVDLQGKTLTPGFIDGHSHFSSFETHDIANVSPPPMGNVHNIPEVIRELQKFKKERNIHDGEWIEAFGYDQEQLEEKRHLTKEDLDAAFPNNPVTVTHASGHMLVANSLALKLSGIDATTKNPPSGGIIVRKQGSNEPTGLLQEGAARLLKRPIKKESLALRLEKIRNQQVFYASNGFTTVQDGYTGYNALELLQSAADSNILFLDVEALPGYETLDKVFANPKYEFGVLRNHLRLAGFKLIADGSPQGKTAFFTKPYLTEVPGCNEDECTGFPNVTQDAFNKAVLKGYQHNVRTFVHCNGDATIDMYIKAIKYADSALGITQNDRRSVVIHSQFVRPDQLSEYKKLGIIPALFSNHAFFWGDVHVKNLGQQRAFFLSPFKAALDSGLHATDHTDYPITPLNQLFLLWTAVARKSRSGQTIGPEQRISPIEALRSITINGAYEYFEEAIKGSIEKGKLADFVILSDNPLTVSTDNIKDIKVLETIKEGKTVYKTGDTFFK